MANKSLDELRSLYEQASAKNTARKATVVSLTTANANLTASNTALSARVTELEAAGADPAVIEGLRSDLAASKLETENIAALLEQLAAEVVSDDLPPPPEAE